MVSKELSVVVLLFLSGALVGALCGFWTTAILVVSALILNSAHKAYKAKDAEELPTNAQPTA